MAKFLGLYSVYAGEKAWACKVAVKRTQMAFHTIFHGALPTIHASGKRYWNVSNFFMHHFRNDIDNDRLK